MSPCSEVSSHQDFYWWVVSDQAQETAYPCLSKVSHPDIWLKAYRDFFLNYTELSDMWAKLCADIM